MARILLVQGHPHPGGGHFCHALADAYAEGAAGGGHEVRRCDVATLDFPLLRDPADWRHGSVPAALVKAQEDLLASTHVVLIFPLWMGDMPALLKGFLEQLLRPGFAVDANALGPIGERLLSGRSARIVVTMGMPAAAYRYWFRAHSVKSLERNILGLVGIAPVHETLIGSVEGGDTRSRTEAIARLRALGARGE